LAYVQQVANANLDSSEKLYLEGVSGVRAYGAGATRLGGSNAQTLTAEVRHNLDFNWRLNGFYDYGKARAYRHNLKADGVTPISNLNDFQIKGYGLTLGWQSVRGIDLKATVAKRLGQNPNPTAQGLDQDGSYKNPRYWLSAMLAF
jgi:hemolysin activation/secretion protein